MAVIGHGVPYPDRSVEMLQLGAGGEGTRSDGTAT